MRLVLTDQTAYEYWMGPTSNLIYSPEGAPGLRLTDFSQFSSLEISQALASRDGSDGNMHLLVGSPKDRRPSRFVTCHVWGNQYPLPEGSIYRIGTGLYVVSPELCLLRLAATLPRLELLHKLSNMLGVFSLDPWDKMLTHRRKPITTINKIRAFLEKVPRARGGNALGSALNWVSERSASPRESSLALNLCMPTRLGGQALPVFEANSKISLSDEALPLTTKSYLEADIAWHAKRTVIEYNSDEYHCNTEAVITDLEKITALLRMNYTVFPLTTRQFDDYEAFESFVHGVRKALGVRDRSSKAAQALRRNTHADLLEIEADQRDQPPLAETARWQYLSPRLDDNAY